MEHLSFVTELLMPNDWMCSIDLTDAYFTIPIHPTHRKYLKFCWKGTLYQYNVLCFGLSSAPRVFTKCTKPILAHLRQKGMRVSMFIDDMIICNQSKSKIMLDVRYIIDCFTSLGFNVNFEKSRIVPSKFITHLGFTLNSELMHISLPQEKIDNIQNNILEVISEHQTSIRKIASILGKFTAYSVATKWGKLYIRNTEREKIMALRECHSYEGFMSLSNTARQELQWWLNVDELIPMPIVFPKPALTITSDASTKGWGAHTNSQSTGGLWSTEEKANHINWLELNACFLGLQCFANNLTACTVQVKLDSMVALAYLNKQGGIIKYLNALTFKIWSWCKQRNLWLLPSFIKGSHNVIADKKSRVFHTATEWCLRLTEFKLICRTFGRPSIDLFASRLNYQVETYCSWEPDPQAFTVDAFSIDWHEFDLCYAFPPFNMIGRVIQKMIIDQAELLLVAPNWPSQHWFPLLHSHMINDSSVIYFKNSSSLLYLPFDRLAVHGIWNKLHLACFRLSGKRS